MIAWPVRVGWMSHPSPGTVTSSTPDENPANNTVSLTLTVNADPDLDLSLGAPLRQDLALPFTLDVYVDLGVIDAHGANAAYLVAFAAGVLAAVAGLALGSPPTAHPESVSASSDHVIP